MTHQRPARCQAASAAPAGLLEVAFEPRACLAIHTIIEVTKPDCDERDDRLEHLLLALRQVLVDQLERDAQRDAQARRPEPTPYQTKRSWRRSPRWRRNAAMIPTISDASTPSRKPDNKGREH